MVLTFCGRSLVISLYLYLLMRGVAEGLLRASNSYLTKLSSSVRGSLKEAYHC